MQVEMKKNELGDSCAEVIVTVLASNSTLTRLGPGFNDIHHVDATAIVVALAKNVTLKS